MSELTRVTLGDALEVLIDHRGKTPKKLGGDWSDSGIRVVSAINIKDRRIDQDNLRYVPEDIFDKWMPVRVRRGDVLLTSEAPLGEVARVRDDEPICLGQRLFGLRGKPGLLDGGYLYYLLGWGEPRDQILERATGTTVSGIRQSELVRVQLELPSVAEQRAIVGVLEALDDKIESNLRICGLVDGLVRSEYQRLSSTESSKSVAVGDIINRVHQAADPSRLSPCTGYIGLEHMPRGSMILDQWGTAEGLDSGKSFFEKSDVLFGKLRPNFRKVGVAPLGGICSTDILVLRPKPGFSVALALAVLTSEEVLGPAIAASSGTKMPRISWDYIAALPVRVPSTSGCDEFADLVDPMIQVAMTSVLENVTLQNTRDALLPELLSGRLRVKDAEKIVEGAV